MLNELVIAFDFGEFNIGVAIGQKITKTASPLKTLKAKNWEPNWMQIEVMLNEWNPKFAIVGLPLNMDLTEQLISKKARKFASSLFNRFNIGVELYDERLTTVEAKRKIFNSGGYKALNRKKIDSIAAAIILEGWFLERN